MKKKLSVDEQVRLLRTKGIKFSIISEEEAKEFLENNTYLFKLKSYAKNYLKNENGQYQALEFAYLVELSLLDTHLRYVVLELCLSIEHQLKVMLLRTITNDPDEDGFSIVEDLLIRHPEIKDDLLRETNSATYDLKQHYQNKMPVWVFVEVCTYHSFIQLFQMYFEKKNPELVKDLLPLIYSSKFIRNACAHNNCLLNALRNTYTKKGEKFRCSPKVKSKLKKLKAVSVKAAENGLSNHIIHDLIASLLLFESVCTSPKMFDNVTSDLKSLLEVRFLRHQEYFISDPLLTSRYNIVLKTLDKLCGQS